MKNEYDEEYDFECTLNGLIFFEYLWGGGGLLILKPLV